MPSLNKIGRRIGKVLEKPINQIEKFLERNPSMWIAVSLILAAIIYFAITKWSCFIKESFKGERTTEDLYGDGSGVRELSSADFTASSDILLKDYIGKKGLVIFYQSWCGYCQRMSDDTKSAAQQINKDKNFIAAVNCGKNEELADRVGVKSYPTIKLIGRDGSMEDYNGGRSADDLVKAVQ